VTRERDTPAAASIPAIRVGLEPGYDYGRTGAWILDLPGCFVWGAERAVSLARVPSAVGAFAWWLARHGDQIDVPATDRVEVVEEIAPSIVEGYERNVTFGTDRRPVTTGELETTIRRLGFARDDLVALVARLDAWEDAHGPLELHEDQRHAARPAGEEMAERTGPAVLRHIGGSEIWLAGRLDRGARFEGPRGDGDVRAWLDATRAWAVERIRGLHAVDSGKSGMDGKGEEWTLAKVLRRLVYHSLDHLGELDRRLARADGAADRLELRRDVLIEPSDLEPLFRSVGWYRLIGNSGRLARLLEGSTEIVSAWDGKHMVGFGRAISDQAAYGLISTVAVHPRWQGKGVARRIVSALLENSDGIRFSLSAVPGVEALYSSVGFVPDERAMVRRRLF
jgi:GNAT superfamily N-acetyltransferase